MQPSTLIITPNWHRFDAVGNDILGMVQALHREGHMVGVHVPHQYDPLHSDWLVDKATAQAMLADSETRMIYHHSIGCPETENLALGAKCNVRVLRYHNVTPEHFLAPYDARGAELCKRGRKALLALTQQATHFLVPSFFNASELLRFGAAPEAIAYQPCFHRLADFQYFPPDPDRNRRLLADKRLRVLFVGRRSPHKGHRHLISAIETYVRRFDREIILHVIGGADAACASYDQELRDMIQQAGVADEVEIHGKLDFAEMLAFYRNCDVFLCLSEHEGFCLPIIEAQYCELPVIAFASGGVPEAMGPSQPLLLSTLDSQESSAALRIIRKDPVEAQQIGKAGAISVRDRFEHAALRARFLRWFDGLVEAGSADTAAAHATVTGARSADGKSDFDAEWYGQRYPDIRILGMEPREHYEWLGKRLGRQPSPEAAAAAETFSE